MKKLIKIITVFLIMTLFCEVSYCAEYLDSVDFVEKDFDYSVIWSGKEWITNTYPPKISQDGVEFTEAEGNEDVYEILKGSTFSYVWTGSDYLVYPTNHNYLAYDSQKYLYRLSADFNSVLNIYEVPNWITHMAFTDDKIFIATRNVKPNYKEPDNALSSVWGISYTDYAVYYSNDYIRWTKFEYNNSTKFNSVYEVNGKLLISNYLYSDGKIDEVLWERNTGHMSCNINGYLCQLYSTQQANGKDVNSRTVLCFSQDGIYRSYIEADENIYMPQKIFTLGNDIVIKGYHDTYACGWEKIKSHIKLPSDPVYVKLNSNILGFETPPVIEDGRTLVPMRFLFEQMGATVKWNQETQTATATLNDTTITFGIDNIEATVNDASVILDVPARLINDKTMVPLRFLSEEMGYNVTWDDASRTAIIE